MKHKKTDARFPLIKLAKKLKVILDQHKHYFLDKFVSIN